MLDILLCCGPVTHLAGRWVAGCLAHRGYNVLIGFYSWPQHEALVAIPVALLTPIIYSTQQRKYFINNEHFVGGQANVKKTCGIQLERHLRPTY